MAKLVSHWYNNVQSLPEDYIFPPETRPGEHVVPVCNTIPVIDLEENNATQQILKASKEFGFFQVINHGVPQNLVNDAMSVFKEFFEMPAKDKEKVCSGKTCKLFTSSVNYNREKVHLWRDVLRHPCLPLEECIQQWPEKPARYREVVRACTVEVQKLGSRILELISQGLGLEAGYLRDELWKELGLSVHHSPPCPDPRMCLGVTKHCDPNLITILQQGNVGGLQVFKDGEWIGVEPIPNAFVVNIGYQLQIISNGMLKSAEHRAVTNSSASRTSAVFFFNPSPDAIIEPAKVLTGVDNPPLYRAFQYREFQMHYLNKQGNTEVVLEHFKLQS